MKHFFLIFPMDSLFLASSRWAEPFQVLLLVNEAVVEELVWPKVFIFLHVFIIGLSIIAHSTLLRRRLESRIAKMFMGQAPSSIWHLLFFFWLDSYMFLEYLIYIEEICFFFIKEELCLLWRIWQLEETGLTFPFTLTSPYTKSWSNNWVFII